MSETDTANRANKEFDKDIYLGLLRTGLWPTTALAYLGMSRSEWHERCAHDSSLREETAKAVAAFEIIHVRNLHTKIQEANDWRGSAWWLEQRFPKRYGQRNQASNVEKAVNEVLTALDQALGAEFNSPSELSRLANVLEKVRLGRSS